jgi:hypothetical protein
MSVWPTGDLICQSKRRTAAGEGRERANSENHRGAHNFGLKPSLGQSDYKGEAFR